MHDKNMPNTLQSILEIACQGTSVTARELIKELSADDLADIKTGYMTAADLTSMVVELADNKDNEKLYRVKVKNTESNNSPENVN